MAAAIKPMTTAPPRTREGLSSVQSADAEIVRRVLGGDRQAFEAIVLAHEQAVFRAARRILGNHEDAEDVAQEAFAAAFTSLGRFNAAQPLRPWLMKIAVNKAISHRRKRRELAPLDEDAHAAEAPSPREQTAAALRRERVDRAMQELPEGSREVVALFYGEGMRIEDVAEALGRKPGAVKVALHRARLRLREIVFGHDERRDGVS